MFKSTFNRVRISVNHKFGNNVVRIWHGAEVYTLRQAKEEIKRYTDHAYQPIDSSVWIAATYDNKPIISCLCFLAGKELDILLFTRNE